MREIKFRAWNKGIMHTVSGIGWTVAYGDWYGPGVGDGIFWVNPDFDKWEGEPKKVDTILMQFTGLKDKNGKEIYEGDILNEPVDKNSRRSLRDHAIVIWKKTGWKRDCYNGDVQVFPDLDVRPLEVIGNIHENPELLEKV